MSKQVLLINDLPGYGKVALAAMMPVLTHMGHNLYNLPTALVSNTLDYGKFDILDTTGYMRNSIAVWKELGFRFDAISTGFIVSEEQAGLVATFCQEQAASGTQIFVDPIMADEGKLYNGITEQTVAHMRQLIHVADYVMPNYTEAAYLVGAKYEERGQSEAGMRDLIDQLRDIGAKSVIITSAKVNGKNVVAGYDHRQKEYYILPFTEIPVKFPGTGDIFSALLLGKVLEGMPLQESTQEAMHVVKEMMIINQGNQDKFKGIAIETCLDLITTVR